MEAGDPPTAPSPRPGPAPALSAPFAPPRRRLDSGGAPGLLRPSSSAPTRGPSSIARNKFPPCPPAGPPLPQPKPVAKKKAAAPRAKKGAAPPAAADRPPPSPSSPPPTARFPVPLDTAGSATPAACSTEFPTRTGSRTTALSGRTPAAVSPRKRSVCTTTSSTAASCPTSSRCRSSSRRAAPPAKKGAPATSLAAGCAADSTVVDALHTFDEMPASSARRRRPTKPSSITPAPPSSQRALATSTSTPPQAQPISRGWGVPAVSWGGAGDRRQSGKARSEREASSTLVAERGHSDQLCQVEAATATHSRSDVAPLADLVDDLLVDGILPQLPDDLLVEILSRLPAKPVHRFKCVSKSWRDLISNPHHRKRPPQALAGLFYQSWCPGEKGHEKKLQFINLSVRGLPLVNPALAFLPNHASIVLADCCNGLLLLFSSYSQPRDYIVCNPATEKWVALPNSGVTGEHWFSALAFDPAVSSHFHVLEYVDKVTHGKVGIFSSRTGGWSHSVKACTEDVFYNWPETVFLNGMLHFICHREVMAIDLETKEWRHIQLRSEVVWSDFFGKSQGCLVDSCADVDSVSLWTLEDYDCGAWSLKHRVSLLQAFGECCRPADGAFHPECNTLFYSRSHEKGISFMSYDFDRGELCHIAAPEFFCTVIDRLLPYVPFFGDIGI